MKPILAGVLAAGVTLSLANGSALAQRVVQDEPIRGRLHNGEFVYVDNGRCGKGRILKVTAGQRAGRHATRGVPRTRECVPRPS